MAMFDVTGGRFAGQCPNCAKHAAFTQEDYFVAWPSYTRMAMRVSGETRWKSLLILRCQYCDKTAILLDTVLDTSTAVGNQYHQSSTLVDRQLVCPEHTPRELDETVPEKIRTLYGEASKCEQGGALRAAGVMYRATVEALIKAQNATGSTLWHKIESLKDRLPEDLITDLHEARMVGNDSIHEGIDYSADEVADIAKLIEEAVFDLYVQPEAQRKMREARQARRESARENNGD